MLRAFQIIRESLSDAELERIVASGAIDQLFARVLTEAVLDRAFIPLRQRLRQATERQVKFATTDLPGPWEGQRPDRVSFDVLNPKVIERSASSTRRWFRHSSPTSSTSFARTSRTASAMA
jgi:hypothetical protein